MSVVRTEVRLNEENIEKFNKYFPKASLSWALDMLLERFTAQFEHTPEFYANLAAQELKDEISR